LNPGRGITGRVNCKESDSPAGSKVVCTFSGSNVGLRKLPGIFKWIKPSGYESE
jgi:hypothetical protein